jgi:hypothetical protein
MAAEQLYPHANSIITRVLIGFLNTHLAGEGKAFATPGSAVWGSAEGCIEEIRRLGNLDTLMRAADPETGKNITMLVMDLIEEMHGCLSTVEGKDVVELTEKRMEIVVANFHSLEGLTLLLQEEKRLAEEGHQPHKDNAGNTIMDLLKSHPNCKPAFESVALIPPCEPPMTWSDIARGDKENTDRAR